MYGGHDSFLQHPEMELFYSTPSRYIDAVYQANLEWTVKTDDFFPYADNPYAYWTGVYVYICMVQNINL